MNSTGWVFKDKFHSPEINDQSFFIQKIA